MKFGAPLLVTKNFYEISSMGRLRSLPRFVRCKGNNAIRLAGGNFVKGAKDKDGYILVGLSYGTKETRKIYRLHRLVLRAFVGDCPPNHESRHLNGKPEDCRLDNLCWGTGIENWQDRKKHGKGVSGSQNPNSRIAKQRRINCIEL